jgi:hypothetical protein
LALVAGATHVGGATATAAEACSQSDALVLERTTYNVVNAARQVARQRTLLQDTDVTLLAQERARNAALREKESVLQALSTRNHRVSESKAVEIVFMLTGVTCPFDVAPVLNADPRVQMLARGEYTHLAVGASADGNGGLTLVLIARRV